MKALAGTPALIRHIIRRDFIKLLLWTVLVGLIPVGMAASYIQLYPTVKELQGFADLVMNSPAEIGVLGYVYAINTGALTAWRAGLNGAFLIAPLSILFVIRHTRVEEEKGRQELISSTVVSRLAPLAAALGVVFSANLVIAFIIAAGLSALGLPVTGSILMGLSAAFTGWLYAALAGLFAQLSADTGASRGYPLVLFALAWFMRAAGDIAGAPGSEGWLSWTSPLGWLRFTRAFAGDQAWVLLLPLLSSAILTMAAGFLAYRRELGTGMIQPRSTELTAASGPATPLALAWRLQRGTLAAWMASAIVFGYLLGVVGKDMSGFVDAPQFKAWAVSMGNMGAGDAFLSLIIYVLGQVVSIFAINGILRLHSEEVSGRSDAILSSPTGRTHWAGSFLILTLLNSLLVMTTLGLSIGLGYGLDSADLLHHGLQLFGRTMVTLPAIWVMAGIATLLYGIMPRVAAAGTWSALAVFLLLELGWELQLIDPALFNFSPFAHVHWTHTVNAAELSALLALAALMITGGLLAFRRRDMA